jgi:hypothetical protein
VGKAKRIRPGQVIWAKVADRNGVVKDQPRPLLVVHPGPDNARSPLCCLCISTEPKTDPEDPAIEMPWDAKTGDTTGLYKWCRVVLLWHILLDQEHVEDISGLVTPSFLSRVIAERENALFWKMARKKR